jgi:hypothetical protein
MPRVTDEEAKRMANDAVDGPRWDLAADLLESRTQVAALTLDLAEHRAALEQARRALEAIEPKHSLACMGAYSVGPCPRPECPVALHRGALAALLKKGT